MQNEGREQQREEREREKKKNLEKLQRTGASSLTPVSPWLRGLPEEESGCPRETEKRRAREEKQKKTREKRASVSFSLISRKRSYPRLVLVCSFLIYKTNDESQMHRLSQGNACGRRNRKPSGGKGG